MAIRLFSAQIRAGLILLAGLALAACQESDAPKAIRPVPAALTARMQQLGMKPDAPIFVRIYKESSELEVWKQQEDGKFGLLKTYSICKWSGQLGPKKVEGDRQAPEGFYTVTPAQMNPNSNYYLSFNIGYPNAYDRAYGRTGTNLMVHGACSSAGCYSMTDDSAGEIFALARDAFAGGQLAFQMQALPFRMTPDNLAKHADDPNLPFWRMLKEGADHFEVTRHVPKVDVCEKKYVFDADAGTANFTPAAACPPYQVPDWIANAVAAKEQADDKRFAQLAASAAPTAQIGFAAPFGAKPAATPAGARLASTAPADLAPAAPKKIALKAPIPPKKPIAEAKVETKLPASKPAVAAKVEAAPPASGTADAKAATPPVETAAAPASANPPVGTLVKKKFLWPDDDTPAMTGSTTPDVSQDSDSN